MASTGQTSARATKKRERPVYEDLNRALIVLALWANKCGEGWQTKLAFEAKVDKAQPNRFAKNIPKPMAIEGHETQPDLPGAIKGLHLLDLHLVADALSLNLSANAISRLEACESFFDVQRVCAILGWDLPERRVEIMTIDPSCVRVSPMVYEEWLHEWSKANLHGHPGPILVTASARHATSHALRMLAAFSGDSRTFLHVMPPRPRAQDERYTAREDSVLMALMRALDPNTLATNATALQVYGALKAAEVTAVIHNAHLVQPAGRAGMLALWNAEHDDTSKLRTSNTTAQPDDRPSVIVHFPSGKEPDSTKIPKPIRNASAMGQDLVFINTLNPPDMEPEIVGKALDSMIGWLETRTQTTPTTTFTMKQSPARTRIWRQVRRLERTGRTISRASLFFLAATLVDPRRLPEGDPTLDFRPLNDSGSRAFEELDLLYTDILCLLHGLPSAMKFAVRLVSTTRHWLTEDMFNTLKSCPSLKVTCTWDDIKDLAHSGLYSLATYDLSSGNEDTSRVRTSLPVKSAVQDEWRRNDPESYAAVHSTLAAILLHWAGEDDETVQKRHKNEYAYSAPLEGAGGVFALEAIRYAKRAAEVDANRESTSRDTIAKGYAIVDRVKPLTSVDSSQGRYALSRKTGSYETVLELLHMLSDGNEANVPSLLLPVQLRRTYHQEVGIARFGSMDLRGAWDAFLRGVQDPHADLQVIIKCLLHAASVATVAHSFQAAEDCIQIAGELNNRSGPDSDMSVRLAVRHGNLQREKGMILASVQTMQLALSPENLIPITGDRALAYVDTLIDAVDAGHSEFLEDISIICNANTRNLHYEGLFYEAARFEVRKARALCRLGLPHAAESLLDTVGVNFLRVHGSPRLHLEWCLACGEALVHQDHHEWAYAGYLESGFQLAQHSGHHFYMRHFARAMTLSLRKMKPRLERQKGENLSDQARRIERYLKRQYGALPDVSLLDGPRAVIAPLTLRASATIRSQHLQRTEQLDAADLHPRHGYDLTRPFRKSRDAVKAMARPDFVPSGLADSLRFLGFGINEGNSASSKASDLDTRTFKVPAEIFDLLGCANTRHLP
jgi:hypothetical protein